MGPALRATGLPEERPPDYTPHLTIARLWTRIRVRRVDRFVEDHAGLALPPFRAGAVTLYESRRNEQGGSYTPLETYALG